MSSTVYRLLRIVGFPKQTLGLRVILFNNSSGFMLLAFQKLTNLSNLKKTKKIFPYTNKRTLSGKRQISMRIFEYTNTILIMIVCLFLENCGEFAFRKDPFGMTMARYENRSAENFVLLAHSGDDCNLLLHKRIHNLGFLFPLNGYTDEEIKEIVTQKMVRYKNVLRIGDIIWTLLLFWTTTLTYSIEIETCNTGMVAVAKHELDYLKDTSKEKNSVPRTEEEEVKKSIEGKSRKYAFGHQQAKRN